MSLEDQIEEFRQAFRRLEEEIGKVIVGQQGVVGDVLTVLFAGGNALLEGVPGLGKTLLVRSLAGALQLEFKRIQFTPDLMPADVVGTHVLMEDGEGRRRFEFRPGPLFANVVLADEINRATPKTQSALLEAMQEHTVSVSSETRRLAEPFFVLATQNPLEMEGTYPLPEAQLDRFLLKITVPFPDRRDLNAILDRTTSGRDSAVEPVIPGDVLVRHQRLVREVPVPSNVQDYAVRLVLATHPDAGGAPEPTRRFVRYGASPRGAQALILAAKVRALRDGRAAVGFDDVRAQGLAALKHRVILNFEAQAEGVRPETLLAGLFESVPRES